MPFGQDDLQSIRQFCPLERRKPRVPLRTRLRQLGTVNGAGDRFVSRIRVDFENVNIVGLDAD